MPVHPANMKQEPTAFGRNSKLQDSSGVIKTNACKLELDMHETRIPSCKWCFAAYNIKPACHEVQINMALFHSVGLCCFIHAKNLAQVIKTWQHTALCRVLLPMAKMDWLNADVMLPGRECSLRGRSLGLHHRSRNICMSPLNKSCSICICF